MKKVMVVFGTRPEAIKMAPVVKALQQDAGIHTCVVTTAQHRQMLDQVLELFEIRPDIDLDLMRPDQDLDSLFAAVVTGMGRTIRRLQPDLVLVHGDTTTTLATGIAAFHAGVPLGHVEAGLRTGNIQAPWPEEANRRLVALLVNLHFAPTASARDNLLSEGVGDKTIFVTGNTVIDALLSVTARVSNNAAIKQRLESEFPYLDVGKRMILVTGHRRESFGQGFDQICNALKTLARRDDVQIVYPVHLNPRVRGPVYRQLSGLRNVFLIEPQEYLAFTYLMSRAHLIITDSGGIQEEAPSLGKPVLVTRNITERPEAIEAGTVRLVGVDTGLIIDTATSLLDEGEAYAAMATAHNPYGDGMAASRVVDTVRRWLQ